MTDPARANRFRPYAVQGLRLAAVLAAYYGSAELGLQQQLVRGQVTPFWPPTGIAVVALLLWGLRMWPGIALGAFVVNVMLGPSILPVLAITVGNTLAPVFACLLLRRVGFRPALDRLQDALALIFLGALGGMLISATVGTGVLVASGALSSHDFWPTWSVWWTGDAMGVLVIAPLLLAVRTARWPRGVPVLRWAEAVALLGGTAVLTAVATRSTVNLLFVVVPFLIWAAFRFQLVGAAPCALIASVIAIDAGADGAGPFSGHDLLAQMVILQAFNGTVALTALLLSAVVTERNQTLREIEEVCERLNEALSRLGPDEAPVRWPSSWPEERDQGSAGQ
ncbi:MASE1 domain-containing protein [Streptomyces sp. S.PNR 29]|uniref:MASE1 domain-containing protein n=1 Tax=Streptomyces sp. S.PNR 29 TaxID=2973805 RepID=UPI0025AFA297|nr:MASE1 domain-containing protein [Streptomyces sp. S.PNR 29]MDN0200511.1 MASE1 domain-containing protein [Streptomyces sp. S.PNR 29]